MDSRYLKSLIAVVDSGSIADAARAEGLTAAAVSQRIQALERELGVELLSRAGHAARATDACVALLPRARRIVGEVALLAGDADDEGLTGTLRIGAISTALTGMLPRVLRTLTERAPGLRPAIVPGTSRWLYQALLAGEIDAAILVAPPFELPRTLRARLLRQEELILLARRRLRGDAAALLQSQPYIRYDPNAWGGRLAQRYLDDQGLRPALLCDLDALETIALLAADGVGVSLVPRWNGLEKLAAGCRMEAVESGQAGLYRRELILLTPVQGARPNMLQLLAEAIPA
ncbi:LysR substrate-binding domain-containing protein [Herbaspirillum sp. WKF16]|jgi:DNA-binding transcriptional LysR family regulator|uniref:LysR substrate-binding domain-containing protein n=1 Tax=Herbaspirillum sp. WKF16 TaxID=3028312 RepID=UPI0023A93470|nr:LysR substrate-binding domain-containing protein [Herbaspirillum sp. WKF16]WDZ94230.1 LysR substrate-binding domain-containing protein [Herbaspirillum sp. WKF16]